MKKWEQFSEEELKQKYIQAGNNKQIFAKLLGYKGTDTRFIKEIQKVYSWLIFSRYEDLTNKVFGKLVVLSKNNTFEDTNHSYWNCQCECGKKIVVRKDSLISGRTKSCGCNSHRAAGIKNMDDLTGKRFGKLTVIRRDFEKTDASRQAFWWCICDCGEKVSVGRNGLKSGATCSCGCLKSKGEEKISKILIDNNIPHIKGYGFDDLRGRKNKLKFDFAIFNSSQSLICLIEFQGIQHFQDMVAWQESLTIDEQRENDRKKKEYCLKNNIPLIEISYKEYKEMNSNYLLNLIYQEGKR